MRVRFVRKAFWTSIVITGLLSALPALAATGPGTITMTTPTANAAVRLTTPITWNWTSGTYTKSTSKVEIQISNNGLTWAVLATNIPIRNGSYAWNTVIVPDGAYALRIRVISTYATIRSTRSPVYVDNTAPQVEITQPSEGDVIVDGERKATIAILAGTATLEAEARDALSGITSIKWLIDGVEKGATNPYSHDFNAETPGEHTITAVVTDRAGNQASHSVKVISLPGPSVLQAPIPLPSAIPSETPSPDPSQLPTPPAVPSPDPSQTPTPPPAPSPLPTTLPSLLPI